MKENFIKENIVIAVEENSPAGKLGVQPGDALLAVNDRTVRDVFDYRYWIQEEKLSILIRRSDGAEKRLHIEKDEMDDLGLTFERGLMDRPKRCANRCVFCLIDQLPKHMRPPLYFKDDDARLSFLSGNYVTLTNMSADELERVLYYHLSPINISVHAAEPDLRASMMSNPKAAELFPMIEKLYDAGLSMNFQVVLCKNINDGAHLDKTIAELSRFMPQAESLSVVPAGLTKHRAGLPALDHFSRDDALAVLRQVENWQTHFLGQGERNSRFVFAADEFYLKAGQLCPPVETYEDFPQLENGVGMLALFARQCDQALRKAKRRTDLKAWPIDLVTGQAAAAFMKKISHKVMKAFPDARLEIHAIDNVFFGENITVSGLLTGQDILAGLKGKSLGRRLLIPANALRDGIFLDDMTLRDLAEQLDIPIKAVKIDGGALIRAWLRPDSSG
ncbi:MAG: DUF512 domain-containing protein [Clostridiales bacterium]|jgi:putative radical SAM enzyme (TIGR03279 family)|nr:DUF512 domain-containing protein [Clostridiales bacterium]